MDIFEADKLFLFVAFVVPGFVTYKAYELFSASSKVEDFGTKIVDAVAYSCANYAILSWLIYLVENSLLSKVHPVLYIFFYAFVIFIFPFFSGWLWFKIRMSSFFQENAPHPVLLPWDYVFRKQEACYAVVTMQDGSKIAGYFGSNSFASSYPAQPQIYLEKEWILNSDGGFEREVESSKGVLVLAADIKSIDFLRSS